MNMGQGVPLLFLIGGLHVVYASGKKSTNYLKSGLCKKNDIKIELATIHIHIIYH